jgi:alpha-beta hydrolase superfamily lysophospholipase
MDLQALRELAADLPDFNVNVAAIETQSAVAYLRYYDIDFAEHYPDLKHRLGTIQSGSYRLCLHCWEQPSAQKTLLLVHGYLDHVGLFGQLIRCGLDRGYNVVAFDLPGHGLSSGERAVIDDFSDYSQAIADVVASCQHLTGRWQVLAQSTGGAALFDYLLTRGAKPFTAAVLLAPLVRPRGWRWINPAQRILGSFRNDVSRVFAKNSSNAAFLKFVHSDPLQSKRLSLRWLGALRRWLANLPEQGTAPIPMLVIQGDADQTVDWRYNVPRIQRLFKGVQLEMLPGARHHLANESELYMKQIFRLSDHFLRADSEEEAS